MKFSKTSTHSEVVMVYKQNNTNKRGFTLVEMLIIAPIVILVIGIFVSAIVSMTGSILASRGANALSYNINDALTRIDQDVKASAGFLSTNSNSVIPLQTGQGLDDGTAIFHNATSAGATDPNDAKLILNSYATDQNPLTPTRNIINAATQPFSCTSSFVNQNSKVMTNIVYFVKNGTLWRRVIMPLNYNTGGACSATWQKPTCTPGYNPATLTFCKANDQRLVDGVTGFAVTYWTNSVPPTAISIASDTTGTQNDTARQAAMQTASSVYVTITAAKTLSGRNVTQTGSIRSLGIQAPSMLTQPTSPTVVTVGSTATFTTAANGTNMTIKWEQSTDNGVTWTTVSGQTLPVLTLSSVTNAMDGNMYHVIYTNSYGQATSSPARLTVTAVAGWNSLSYQNSWGNYNTGFNTGGYLKTTKGIVILRGLLIRTGTAVSGEVIATLPAGYRPSGPLVFVDSANVTGSGRIDIYPNGNIVYVIGDAGYDSLENIHFVADTGQYTSTTINSFYNGWSNYGGGWAQASYIVDSIGRVNIQGLLTPGTNVDDTRVYDLPSNLLPSNYMHVPETGGGSNFASIAVDPRPGYSAVKGKGLGTGYLTTNVMYYPAAYSASWTSLTLQNSWVYDTDNSNLFSSPQYTKAADGLVSVKGLIRSGTTTVDTIIATLPVGYRPIGRALFTAYSNGAYSRIDIDATGNIRFESGSNAWLSLDGLTFYADQ
jgi:type II secretory pathway pseudopilin PulG